MYPSLKLPDAAVDEVHAHDLPLNVLVENGLLGLGAFAWAVIAGVLAVRRTLARIPPDDLERTLLAFGLVAGFIASAVQNVLDVVSTFVFLLWWPMLGLLLSLAPVPRRVDARQPAAAVAAAALLLTGCGGSGAAGPRATESPPQQPPYYIVAKALADRPVELKEIHDGKLEYLLRSSQIAYQTADSKGILSGVALNFYKGGTVRLRVTAPTAEVLPDSRNVALRGGAHASSANGAAMTAQTIEYDGIRHVLVATGHVRAQDDHGNSIDGDRAIADLDLQTVHVWGPHGEQTMTFGK